MNDDESNELMRPVGGRVHPSDSSVLLMNLRTDGGEGGLFRYDGTWTNITDTIVDNTWSAGSGFSELLRNVLRSMPPIPA